MLSLGPTSSCDICYEQFGDDPKAPWSIECGHVFCGECLQNVNDPRLCPMCRSPFEQESCIKLHVDIDTLPSETSGADAREARRLQHAIASIPETGATEPSLRQLIQEGSKFLSTQPRNTHKELRNAHRVIAYLYEVKMLHRAQAQAIESIKDQANQLTNEKAELLKQLEKLEETRQYETETAAAVENTLREHCAQAKQAQKVVYEQLKKLDQENEELRNRLRITSTRCATKSTYTSPELVEPAPTNNYFDMPRTFNKLDIGREDPSSFLISPLPQFTSNLPAMFNDFSPLPDLAEDDDQSQSGSTDEDEEEEVVTPDSSLNQQQLRPAEPRDIKPQFTPSEPPPAPRPPQEPSGLSRTAPFREHRRRERSSSSPTPSSRSQSPFDTVLTSTSTTPPLHTTTIHHGMSSREARPVITQDRHVLRSRLQDILSDAPPPSSSLPTSPSFPSSLPRDHNSNVNKDDRNHTGPSRSSEPFTSSPPQQVPGGSSHPYASTSQNVANKQSSSGSPTHLVGPRMSSASAEAKKLEEERRRKHWEDKYGPEYDKQPTDADREQRWYPPAPSNSVNSVISATSSASQAARREQHPHSNSVSGNLMPSLKRSSTTSGSYAGRLGTNSLRSTYGPDQGLAPVSGHPYSASSLKNSSKSSTLQSSHSPTIYT